MSCFLFPFFLLLCFLCFLFIFSSILFFPTLAFLLFFPIFLFFTSSLAFSFFFFFFKSSEQTAKPAKIRAEVFCCKKKDFLLRNFDFWTGSSFFFLFSCISFKKFSLLVSVSEFNCFLRSRCSIEMWCLDDIGRDSWDWVGPPAWVRACFNSPEWGGGASPVKTEAPQIVLLLLFWTLFKSVCIITSFKHALSYQLFKSVQTWRRGPAQNPGIIPPQSCTEQEHVSHHPDHLASSCDQE